VSEASPVRIRIRAAADVVKPVLLRGWREALRRRAVDETEAAAERSCLVLAPHPDDETLGAGALIARKRAAGTRVRVVVVTDGRGSHASREITPDQLAALRRAESLRACARLGVDAGDVVHLDLHEGTVSRSFDDVVARVVDQVERFEPRDVLVTSALDWHVDHRALAQVARAAVQQFPGVRLLEYPVWCWADGPWSNRPGRSAPAAARDLVLEPVVTAWQARPVSIRADPLHLAAKRAALDAYSSQVRNLTGEPDWAVMDEAFLAQFLQPQELFFPTASMPSRSVERSVAW
jgi:LmbE family N-acetylglucosaminyl deacetylase